MKTLFLGILIGCVLTFSIGSYIPPRVSAVTPITPAIIAAPFHAPNNPYCDRVIISLFCGDCPAGQTADHVCQAQAAHDYYIMMATINQSCCNKYDAAVSEYNNCTSVAGSVFTTCMAGAITPAQIAACTTAYNKSMQACANILNTDLDEIHNFWGSECAGAASDFQADCAACCHVN